MKRLPFNFLLLFIFAALVSCREETRSKHGKEKDLLIATASNMQYALEPLLEKFRASTGLSCRQVVGSSGKLTAQVISGAPFDIFLSADMQYPETLYLKGFGKEKPQIYAYGRLVLWSLSESELVFPASILNDSIAYIAVANPETAPYGKAARQAMEAHGIWKQVASKLVYGESVSQVNQFVLSGGAELGFTSESVVRSPALRGRGLWVAVPEELHEPIAQGVLLLNTGEASTEAQQAFLKFLQSGEARKILRKFGYSTFEQPSENKKP